MMLGGQNQPLHAGVFSGAHDLLGIEVSRIEERRIFIAIAPLFIGEGVDGEMHEAVEFELVPTELTRRRDRSERGWRRNPPRRWRLPRRFFGLRGRNQRA